LSATYATPLELDIKPSRWLKAYLQAVHLLAAGALLLLPLATYLQGLLVLLLLALYRHSCRRYLRACRLQWRDSGWRLYRDGVAYGADLLPGSLLTRWLTLLNFRLDTGQRLSVPLLADALEADDFRRLRVRLRVSGNKLPDRARIQ